MSVIAIRDETLRAMGAPGPIIRREVIGGFMVTPYWPGAPENARPPMDLLAVRSGTGIESRVRLSPDGDLTAINATTGRVTATGRQRIVENVCYDIHVAIRVDDLAIVGIDPEVTS